VSAATQIRELVPDDLPAVLEMNNAVVPTVNPHDAASLVDLIAIADRCWVLDDGGALGGLLVVFAPGGSYQSRNYRWFDEHYDNYIYVDRIVVASTHRRLGLAGRLYDTAVVHAVAESRERLFCEVNVEPPNPQSIAFHEAYGWSAIADHRHSPTELVRFFEYRC